MKKMIGFILGIALFLVLGCNEMGTVIQGRVIAYDKDKGQVTFLEDLSVVKGQPNYGNMTPVVFSIPADPNEMGPQPKTGLRVGLFTDRNTISIYHPDMKTIEDIIYRPVETKESIDSDNKLVSGIPFPVVDRNAKTIQIYSKRQKLLVTFALPEPYFDLPDQTWAAGDEIRIYYKEKGKALRMMNITQTDIFKK